MRDIFKRYGTLEVLKGIDLLAYAGNVMSLIWSSGSVKSTLLRCANLLEYSDKGDIIFQNETIRWNVKQNQRYPADKKQVASLRTQLSMVFQQFNLWWHMTILNNGFEAPVTVLGEPLKKAKSDAMNWLEQVGIADKANNFPQNYLLVSNNVQLSQEH